MPAAEQSPCPACGAAPGTLSIEVGLRAQPIGTFSLAGAQMKVSAHSVPLLCCSACGMRLAGQVDDDGGHVTFNPPGKRTERSDVDALEPTSDLLNTARRVATRTWTLAENEPGYPTDPHLQQLVDAGYVVLHFPPTRLRDDYWTLTPRGHEWLAEHDKEEG